MQRTIGNTALSVYPVGLGAMPLSLADRPDRERALDVLTTALDAGMNFIDTADCYCLDDGDYGHNEQLIAEALRANGREAIVATKGGLVRPGGAWQPDGRPAHLREACERSLRLLEREAIDLYYLHAPDPEVPFADSVGELARLREAGKIRHIGLSNVNREQLRQALTIVPIAAVENRCNILEKGDLCNGMIDYCDEQGVGYVAYSPAGGHNGHVRLQDIDALNEVAARHGTNGHAIAVAWLLSKDEHIVPIPGASRPESARASAAAARIELSDNDIALLDSIPDW